MGFTLLAFIGRFQPFHNGHAAIITEALKKAKRVLVIIGSHDQPRSVRNPFTTSERMAMIAATFPAEVAEGRLLMVGQVDHPYNEDRWRAEVQSAVYTAANNPFTPDPIRIGLIGHSKDASSYYLRTFPTWESIEVPNVSGINATDIRNLMFGWNALPELVNSKGWIPSGTNKILNSWMKDGVSRSAQYEALNEEAQFIETYKRQWAKSPYPPTFVTTDAVVVQSGHVLLIKRREMPGKGLWALPGGFLNQDETIIAGVLRELREETCIALQDATLKECIERIEVFDAPNRSQRGRTITHAALIRLRDDTKLVKVKGADDAERATWVPLADLRPDQFFEDHYAIISTFLGL